MEINFIMSAQDYLTALRARNKKINNPTKSNIVFILLSVCLIAALTVISVLTKDSFYAGTFGIFLIITVIFRYVNEKRSIMKAYDESPVVQSMHTIRTYRDGLEIINSYEKLFVPWEGIYMSENTDSHFIIMPSYGHVYAIDKHKYASQTLDNIIAQINSGGANV